MSPASVLRRGLWRGVCALLGGLTVRGRWEAETGRGCVVVANHSSHGDTAALLAALPAGARPVFAAAADYWFAVPVRRVLATNLAGILPVRRDGDGAYAALLAAAGPALATGATVVVYPEGTRTEDGTVGRFHSGALRLARDCGVPVVPVAVLGTRELLPKNGRLTPSPLEVRIGAPRDPRTVEAADLREDVVAMLAQGSAARRTSRVWRATGRLVRSRAGLVAAFAWGVAEATSWPVTAEMALVLAAVAVPRRVPAWAAALTLGSVAGVLTTAWLASRGVHLPAPWTTARMLAAATDRLAAGPVGMLHQPLDGVPVKVYARAAGDAGLDPAGLAGWTAVARGARTAVVALVVGLVARALHPWLRWLWGPYLVVVGTGFAVGLALVVASWG